MCPSVALKPIPSSLKADLSSHSQGAGRDDWPPVFMFDLKTG